MKIYPPFLTPSTNTTSKMATRERQMMHNHPRRKKPSFSSSLLDSIYQSIDESKEQQEIEDTAFPRKKNVVQVENGIHSSRRAMMIETWMANYGNAPTPRHFSSNSGSSTDSSMFSSSKSTPKSLDVSPYQKQKEEKIYGDLKKIKVPISPGRRITNFLNSIFSPRKLKKNEVMEEWRKSRSMKDTTTSCSLVSKSCLRQKPNSSSRGNHKPKRSVRFCAVSGVVDEDSPTKVSRQCTGSYLSSTGLSSTRPRGRKSIYDYDCPSSAPMPNVGSQFIKKNIESLRLEEVKNFSEREFRDQFYENESDLDDKSCASSDLFELDHNVRVGIGKYEQELPVYGTTSLEAIASEFAM